MSLFTDLVEHLLRTFFRTERAYVKGSSAKSRGQHMLIAVIVVVHHNDRSALVGCESYGCVSVEQDQLVGFGKAVAIQICRSVVADDDTPAQIMCYLAQGHR